MLLKIPVFENLKARELRQVAGIVHRRQYVAGEYVCFQNDPGLGMYVVEQGEVSVILLGTNGYKKGVGSVEGRGFLRRAVIARRIAALSIGHRADGYKLDWILSPGFI